MTRAKYASPGDSSSGKPESRLSIRVIGIVIFDGGMLMDNSTKNMVVLAGAAIVGGWGGSWASGRIGAAMGLSLGPWGSAAGAVVGALLGTALAKNVLGADTQVLPDPESIAEATADLTKT